MQSAKSNGLTADNSQPAETYTLSTNACDYPTGRRLRKEEAARCCALGVRHE